MSTAAWARSKQDHSRIDPRGRRSAALCCLRIICPSMDQANWRSLRRETRHVACHRSAHNNFRPRGSPAHSVRCARCGGVTAHIAKRPPSELPLKAGDGGFSGNEQPGEGGQTSLNAQMLKVRDLPARKSVMSSAVVIVALRVFFYRDSRTSRIHPDSHSASATCNQVRDSRNDRRVRGGHLLRCQEK